MKIIDDLKIIEGDVCESYSLIIGQAIIKIENCQYNIKEIIELVEKDSAYKYEGSYSYEIHQMLKSTRDENNK